MPSTTFPTILHALIAKVRTAQEIPVLRLGESNGGEMEVSPYIGPTPTLALSNRVRVAISAHLETSARSAYSILLSIQKRGHSDSVSGWAAMDPRQAGKYNPTCTYLEAAETFLRVRPIVEVLVLRHARLLASLEKHLRQGIHVPSVLDLHQPALPVELALLLRSVVLPSSTHHVRRVR